MKENIYTDRNYSLDMNASHHKKSNRKFHFPNPLGNCSMRYSTSCMAQASLSTGFQSHLLPAVVPEREGVYGTAVTPTLLIYRSSSWLASAWNDSETLWQCRNSRFKTGNDPYHRKVSSDFSELPGSDSEQLKKSLKIFPRVSLLEIYIRVL